VQREREDADRGGGGTRRLGRGLLTGVLSGETWRRRPRLNSLSLSTLSLCGYIYIYPHPPTSGLLPGLGADGGVGECCLVSPQGWLCESIRQDEASVRPLSSVLPCRIHPLSPVLPCRERFICICKLRASISIGFRPPAPSLLPGPGAESVDGGQRSAAHLRSHCWLPRAQRGFAAAALAAPHAPLADAAHLGVGRCKGGIHVTIVTHRGYMRRLL
jgi:hypothetical protein